ncbi:MAG: MBL fold metallo-hydrolase [Chloroflexi bacterium]|nr:MBL fold metallo-hydrolase [Chloroflexota bacterium]
MAVIKMRRVTDPPRTQVLKGIFKIGPIRHDRPSPDTYSFLVAGGEGAAMRAAIVEPGEDGQVPGLVKAIRELGVDLDRVLYVFATHIHFHHMQGVPWLLRELPKAKFVVHPRAAPHVIDPTRLIESTLMAWGDKCYGPFEPISKEKVIGAEDGQVFDIGGRGLEVIHTPGHAPHHMSILDRETRAMFPGDLTGAGEGGPGHERGRPEILPPLFDFDGAIQGLRKVRALKPTVFLRFGGQMECFIPDKLLQWDEEVITKVRDICLEGMRQKIGYEKLSEKVEAYFDSLNIPPGVETQVREGGKPGAPFGMLAYLKRKYPELEMPVSASPQMRRGTRSPGFARSE